VPPTLVAERDAARRLVDDLRSELEGIITAQEAAPPDDEHDVEGSSVGFERARVTALLDHAEARLAALAEAIGRAEAGADVGRCEVCGGPIGEERLAAVPTTRRCVGCSAAPPTRGFTRR
jgi:RNA polymerase-binding transcription factor DksA